MTLREAVGTESGASLIEVEGVKLAVARQGRGTRVVCLHAVGHGAGDFGPFARAVGGAFEVIRVDWPGHGRSTTDREPTSARRYAELLVALLDQLGIHQPIVLGNSIGGAAALLYAERRPVRALVLCDSGGLLQVNLLVRLFCAAFARFFAAGARGARWFKAAFAWYYRHLVLPTPAAAEQRERIIAAGYELAPQLRDAWLSFGEPGADLRAQAAALQVPIWCAWGKYDRVIPLARCRAAIDRMQRATLTQFEAGHSPFLECPAEFAAAFTKFAASVPVPSLPLAKPDATPNLDGLSQVQPVQS